MGIVTKTATWIDTLWPTIQSRTITQQPAFNSRAGIAHVDLPQTIIRYRLAGKGQQTVVLAADPPVMIEQYDELIRQLENDFRVIVFELPGFGFSLPRSGFHFDFTDANNLTAEFLRRINLGPYVLAFPCVSAYGAVDIAARFPGLVSGVVLMQAPAWGEEIKWKHRRDQRGILSKPILGQLMLQMFKRRISPQWFGAAVGKRDMLSGFIKTTDEALAHGACFCLASAFQHYLTDISPALTAVNQPSLIIWGEADRSHRHTDKSTSKLYCPQAQDIRFEAAGHFPELESPEAFAHALKEWTRALSPKD